MGQRTAGCRGVTLVEALVALLIVGASMAAMVSLWQFSYRITNRNDATGAAYNIGRRTVEHMKQGGFTAMKSLLDTANAAAGGATPGVAISTCLYYEPGNSYVSAIYYNRYGEGENLASGEYRASATATALSWTTDTPGTSGYASTVATDSLIALDITVTQVSDNSVVYRTGTYLKRLGL